MRSGRDITERDLEKEVNAIIGGAVKAALFDPADDFTIFNIRTAMATGLSALKTRGVIKGYRIDVQLEGTKILGSVTYTPLRVVKDVVIDIGVANANDKSFKRAMKGI